MKLEDNNNLKKVKQMIKDGSIMDFGNLMWFCKYLINDYSKKKNKEIEFNCDFDVQEYEYSMDSYGVFCKDAWDSSYMSEVKYINSMDLSFDQAIFTVFREFGYRLLMEEQSFYNMNYSFVFDNPAGYNKRQYMFFKESAFDTAIGENHSETIDQLYLSENEAIILGGNVFLDYIRDNFSDCECFNGLVEYFQESVNVATQLIYGQARDNFNDTIDKFIMNNYEYFLENYPDLIVEFNRDGNKKSVFHILMYRCSLNKQLEEKMITSDENVEQKIQEAIKVNDNLFRYFIYNAIKELPVEGIVELINLLSLDDLEYVYSSIKDSYIEISNTVEYLNNYGFEKAIQLDLVGHWQNKLNKCFCIKKIFEDSMGKRFIKNK